MSVELYAERHDALVPVVVARRAGLSHCQMKTRRRRGQWRSVRRGVNAVCGAPPTWRQAVRASVMAAGRGVAVSHFSAVRLYGIDIGAGQGARIHVTGVLARHVRLAGVVGHRSGTLERGDVVRRDEMAVTSPIRTIIDLSGHIPADDLGRVLDEFLRRKLINLEALRARVDTVRPAPGRRVRVLRALLAGRIAGYDPGESVLERDLVAVIVANGFPGPVQQHPVRAGGRRYRMDGAYPDQRLYIEGHGYRFHSQASDLDRDARRQNDLVANGWRPITFTWRMTTPEIVTVMDAFYDRVKHAWRH